LLTPQPKLIRKGEWLGSFRLKEQLEQCNIL
jgi:hypothetical protein